MSSTLTATRPVSSLTTNEQARLTLLLSMDDEELNAKYSNLTELGKLARADQNANKQVLERLNQWTGPYSLPDVEVNYRSEGREILLHDLTSNDFLMRRIGELRDDLNRRLGAATTRITREVNDPSGRKIGNVYLVSWPKGTHTLYTQINEGGALKLHQSEHAALNSPLEDLSISELFLTMDSTSF